MYIYTCMRRSGDTMLNACMDRQEEEEEAMKQQAEPSPAPPPATKYRGVRMRKWGKWVAEARYPNSRERLWLGSYPSAKMAAMAYDAAVYCMRGPGEALNFPDHPPNIPSADRLSRYEIREAAGRHAEQARLLEQESSSAAGPSAGESNSGLAEAASATLPGEPLQDLFEPESGGGGEWAGVEDEDFWAGGGDVGGGNDDDSDGDMFGVFPLWNFQFPK